jgi:Kef-type K+ transport system membrane component KefB
MFLLFEIGLEVKSSELLKVGGTALLIATLGATVPFAAGWGRSALGRHPVYRLRRCGAGVGQGVG